MLFLSLWACFVVLTLTPRGFYPAAPDRRVGAWRWARGFPSLRDSTRRAWEEKSGKSPRPAYLTGLGPVRVGLASACGRVACSVTTLPLECSWYRSLAGGRSMDAALVIRGRVCGGAFIPTEPVPDVELRLRN